MRLCRFQADGATHLGAVSGPDTVVDLTAAGLRVPADLGSLFTEERAGLLAARVADAPEAARLRLGQVRLTAPVPRPSKIIGIGLNYRDHAAETGQDVPARPTVFAKFPTTLSGPYDPIVLPSQSGAVDYEGELGVVVGRQARAVPEEAALSYVGGYLALNDVSARDVQNWTSQWTLGKSFDGFAPVGPFLVTAADVPDPQDLRIETRLNGVTVQASSTANMVFTVAVLVSALSAVMTLEPGDIIATGTPGGIGAAQDPPRFLRAGDVVEVEIERLGCLRNLVTTEVAVTSEPARPAQLKG